MKSRLHFIAAMVCAVFLAACGGVSNDTATVAIDPTTQPAGYSAIDAPIGTGTDVVDANDAITVTYKLWLYKSTAAGLKATDQPIESGSLLIVVGTGNVIPGIDQGVVGMKVGGMRQMILPASLAYGARTIYKSDGVTVLIPANAGLVYEITLTSLIKK